MDRKKVLITATSLLGVIGVLLASLPFIKSMSIPGYIVNEEMNTSVFIELEGMKEREIRIVPWQGVPIAVYKRTTSDIEELEVTKIQVHYPKSSSQKKPDWWKRMYIDTNSEWVKTNERSIKPEFFVFNMVSPNSGCAVRHMPGAKIESRELNIEIPGNFYDPCKKVYYDLSGRIYKREPYSTHLFIPPYRFVSDNTIELYPNG